MAFSTRTVRSRSRASSTVSYVSYLCGALGLFALLPACRPAPPDSGDHENATSSSQALTQVVTYKRGVVGTVSDTSIASSALKKNFGNDAKLRVSAKNEALLRFDLSAVPSNAVIDRATLALYLSGGEDEEDDDCQGGDKHGFPVVPIYVHRATAPWVESTVTYTSFAQRFDPTPAGIILPTSRNALKSVDVKSLVQGWVSHTNDNEGLVLRTDAKKHTIIVSSEGRTASLRPSLSLTYTTPDDHCTPTSCQNGGTCSNGATSFTCACPAGYTGAGCETVIDNCAVNPCRNGGTCSSGAGSFTCACPNGFTGTTCETNIDDCAANPCLNGGVCTDGIHAFTCACPAGFAGSQCETLIDNCAQAPCQNGGTCSSGIGSYACSCPTGFTGANCETNIDDCAGSPCQNGGSCSDGIATFTCSCAPGYTGATCSTLIDNCAAVPCQNGGSCTNAVNAYSCDCAPGFSGTHCETDINDCAANLCQNGGLCVDGVSTFTCQCLPAFTGDMCQTALPTDPCLANGGTYTTRAGDYTINSSTSLSALRCVREVTGTLFVDGDSATTVVDLPGMQRVGALRVTAASQVTRLTLGGLETVGGFVEIVNNPALAELDAGALVNVGDIYVQNNASLRRFALGNFGSTRSLALLANAQLADLGAVGFGHLSSVTNNLSVRNNPKLVSLGPNGLSSLASAGNIEIVANPLLADLGPTSLSSLASVGGYFQVESSPLLTSIDVSHASLGGVYLRFNPGLTSVRLGPLPAQVSYVVVEGSPLLTDLGPTALAGVQRITQQLRIGNTGLASFGPNGLSDLVSVAGTVEIFNNPALSTLGPTSLSSLTSVGGYFQVEGSPLLTSIDVSHASLGGLYMRFNSGLTSARLGPLPAQVSYVVIEGSPLLTDLGPTALEGVQRITQQLRVGNTGLASFGPNGLSDLVSVAGTVEIFNNPALSTLGPTSLSSLTSVGGFFQVEGSPLLTSIDVSHASLGGLYVRNDAGLASLRLGPLPAQLSYLFLQGLPNLNDLGPTAFSSVRQVTIELSIAQTGLSSLGPDGLGNVVSARRFEIYSNPNLTTLGPTGLSSLTGVGTGGMNVEINPRLTQVAAPSLASIGGNLVVDRNLTLDELSFGALTSLAGNLRITNNPALASCFTALRAQLVGYSGTVTITGNALVCQ